MSFRLIINESDKNILIQQQQNYFDFQNDTIKVRHAFSENLTYEFSYTGNIVQFQVPFSGTYKIEAWGARGGSSSSSTGPLGAYSKSFVLLNKDERIKILVGEKGSPGYNHNDCIYCGGGGGGTFIAIDNTPLCVAGGGGGFVYYSHSTVSSHACGQATQLSASFGTGQATLKMGGIGSVYAGGGGGFEGDGGDGSSNGKGGYSFINGGERQKYGSTYGEGCAYGGFGGGASQHGCGYGAGGGGYTGGSASGSNYDQGGGGGSYYKGSYNNEASNAISGCSSSLPTNPGTNGNGFARLTLFISKPSSTINKCPTYSCYKIPILWTHYTILLSQ
jgi:hypothetical protein